MKITQSESDHNVSFSIAMIGDGPNCGWINITQYKELFGGKWRAPVVSWSASDKASVATAIAFADGLRKAAEIVQVLDGRTGTDDCGPMEIRGVVGA